VGVLAVALAGLLAFAGCDVSEDANVERGRALFQQKCGTCHTLAEAGTSATVGPNLDDAFAASREDGMDNDTIEGVVQDQIENPRVVPATQPNASRTAMPADLVTGQDTEDVATYVASVAGVPGAAPPKLPPDQLFTERCGSCHTLSAAGTSGTTGPDLDDVLVGKDAKYVEEQIVDPNSEIAKGYPPGVMPQDFEDTLSPQELQGLVEYILDSVGK
jgi:mono/diheme cytochrome c family protein